MKQRIQFTGALECEQVIATTDMLVTDPDLRHGRASRFLGHLGAHLGLAINLDLFEDNALFTSRALARMQ